MSAYLLAPEALSTQALLFPPQGDRVPGLADVMHSNVGAHSVGSVHLAWGGSTGSNALGTSNLGLWCYLWIPEPFSCTGVWWNGTNTTGSIDVALYTRDLATRVVEGSGANANAMTEVTFAATRIDAGQYWIALAGNNSASTLACMNAGVLRWRSIGAFQQASAYTLPTGGGVTPATYTPTFMPIMGLSGRALIA